MPGKLVSLFEPHTEMIRKGKAAKPTEFGKMVKIQEAENADRHRTTRSTGKRPSDCDLLLAGSGCASPTLGPHARIWSPPMPPSSTQRNELGRAGPRRQASRASPIAPPKARERKQLEKKRWFRNAQKWRTGCEGRISLLKRRHGLNRCRYKGMHGIERWVGLGVIADNLINIGHALAPER